MLFNSFTYLVFLPVVVALYWLLPPFLRRGLLLVASYVFYMNWIPQYGLLIFALTVVNYFVGRAIASLEKQRKVILTAGLVFNLGCLCFYKYANFLIESVWASLAWLHHNASLPFDPGATSPVLTILLPLGISFFTFEFIHYITDVYRGSAPIRNFWHFALFAVFFPSQIAGPIKRFQDFHRQMLEQPIFKVACFKEGIFLVFLGLFKKIVLGDNIGVVVNAAYANVDKVGTTDAWIAAVGFVLQVFFDFSGYTDIGRGSALLFGYKVPENFYRPYLACSPTEFWRRWHISLSTWLRDYLFIPLGGSRVGPWRLRLNLFITMTLGGLWHGAAWHYVIWGAGHGIALIAHKEWQELVSRVPVLARLRPGRVWHVSGIVVTMLFLTATHILFRSETIEQALNMAGRLLALRPSGQVTELFLTSTLPVSLLVYSLWLACRLLSERAPAAGEAIPAPAAGLPFVLKSVAGWWDRSIPARVVVYASVAIVILGFAPGQVQPFIYFQF